MQPWGKMKEAPAALPHPRSTKCFTWCFRATEHLCLHQELCPSESFLWISQPNSYASCLSTTCISTLDHSSECSQLWVEQEPFPIGSTRYRHSLSLGKTCSTSHLWVTSQTLELHLPLLTFLIYKGQVGHFKADVLFATSWHRFLASSVVSFQMPVLNTYQMPWSS